MMTSGSFREDVDTEVAASDNVVSETLISFLHCLKKKKKSYYAFKSVDFNHIPTT